MNGNSTFFSYPVHFARSAVSSARSCDRCKFLVRSGRPSSWPGPGLPHCTQVIQEEDKRRFLRTQFLWVLGSEVPSCRWPFGICTSLFFCGKSFSASASSNYPLPYFLSCCSFEFPSMFLCRPAAAKEASQLEGPVAAKPFPLERVNYCIHSVVRSAST